ncbi:neuronal acetylcholine receptor subunit alpha-3-like isoform X1 [Cydia strobilella]|uniref:neuronal acetylcholine receptor subunit alpha-3-like isoform X1 n=1 Tax=Cydia strobilella TaxID=1100964 RepID=UPI0030040CD4
MVSRLLLLLAAVHVSRASAACNNVSAVSITLDTLFAEYAQYMAPATPVAVRAALDVRHASVDEGAVVVRLLADLRLSWQDPRLAWNETELECKSVLVPAERLWRPDVELLNGAAGGGADGSVRARLTSDSKVLWIQRLNVAVPLAIDLIDWPRDQQSAVFTFGSREHTAEEIALGIDDFRYATVWESGTWMIEAVVAEKAALGSKPVISWNVVLRRRAAAHALASGAVLMAAALVLLTAVVLPPQQRHSLCACAAFTAALWLTSALLRFPGSATCPRTLLCMAGVLGAAGACCAVAAMLARLARVQRPPPPQLRALLSKAPAWIVATSPQDGDSTSASWAAAAQLLDNVLRAALALTLLILVCVAL